VNGCKVREKKFEHMIVDWCAFDFVFVVEAFTLREGPTLFQSHPAFAFLKYDVTRRGFAVATPDGCGHMVPCDPTETFGRHSIVCSCATADLD
jgi:hypothetical protein